MSADSWRLLPSSIPYTGLATVELDTGMSPQGGTECIVQWAYPVWAGDDIRVVKEREDGLSVTQLGLDLAEGGLLCQGIKGWHEGVPLFPTLALGDEVATAGVISPRMRAGRAVKLPGEGHERSQVRVTEQGTEHCLPGDVGRTHRRRRRTTRLHADRAQ